MPRRGEFGCGAVLAALVALSVAILVLGVAAFVTVPTTVALLILILARPEGVGPRIRGWRLWRRVPGLNSRRRVGTFAALLCLYGVVVPGACLALLMVAVRSNNANGGNGAGNVPISNVTPNPATSAFPTPTDAPASPIPQPATAHAVGPVTTTAPTRSATVDPCHHGAFTYCVLNPAITQSTINQTICVSGWTATVRPSESYTESLKRKQIAAEGLLGQLSDYEEDHRMPLELGGAPSDLMNLSPESPPTPNPKDSDETTLKHEVCGGQLTLLQAQRQLVATWLAPYPRYTH